MSHFINTACTRCAACLLECPTGSILEGKTHYIIDSDTCDDHGICVSVCPVNAIHPSPPKATSKTGAKPEKEKKS